MWSTGCLRDVCERRLFNDSRSGDSDDKNLAWGDRSIFEVDEFRKHCLFNGLDDIALTLNSADAIRSYEQGWREKSPWLFDVIK